MLCETEYIYNLFYHCNSNTSECPLPKKKKRKRKSGCLNEVAVVKAISIPISIRTQTPIMILMSESFTQGAADTSDCLVERFITETCLTLCKQT